MTKLSSLSVKTDTSGVKELNKALQTLKRSSLYVGIPDSGRDRGDGSGLSNSDLGYLHEIGSSDGRIPARPFLMPAVQGREKEIRQGFKKAMQLALGNQEKAALDQLEAVGLSTAVAVQLYIRESSHFVPNKPATIKRKTIDGRIKNKPLIDSEALLGSVVAIVTKD